MPECPNPAHRGSRVVKAGRYGRAPHQRQRFKCTPRDGSAPHRFVPVLPRQMATVSHCSECSAQLESWQGQAGARLYSFDARAVAHCLARVARGASYRQASIDERQLRRGQRHQRWETSGQLASNWVEVFTPVVTYPDEPAMWPEVLVVDSKRFLPNTKAGSRPWYVFVAAGGEGRHADPLTMLPARDKTAEDWERFFKHLPGQPRLVVCDMEAAIRRAAWNVWPGTQVYLCEHHVRMKLREKLGVLPLGHPLWQLYEDMFRSQRDWEAFRDACFYAPRQYPSLSGLGRFFREHGQLIADGLVARQPRDPRSNAAAEAMTRKLGHALPRVRANRLTNLYRTSNLLRLLSAEQRGNVNELLWAVRIRKFLEAHQGRMLLTQRSNDDPKGQPSLYR